MSVCGSVPFQNIKCVSALSEMVANMNATQAINRKAFLYQDEFCFLSCYSLYLSSSLLCWLNCLFCETVSHSKERTQLKSNSHEKAKRGFSQI